MPQQDKLLWEEAFLEAYGVNRTLNPWALNPLLRPYIKAPKLRPLIPILRARDRREKRADTEAKSELKHQRRIVRREAKKALAIARLNLCDVSGKTMREGQCLTSAEVASAIEQEKVQKEQELKKVHTEPMINLHQM